MKVTRTFLVVWLLVILGIGIYTTDNVLAGTTPAPSNPAFDKLKTLVGTWESKTPDGKTASMTVRLTGNGSALVFDMQEGGGMITVVHPDGANLMATHYCGAGNQPRFVMVPSSDPNVIAFQFKDVTNLASPEAGHMRGVSFKLVDADRHREDWTWIENGKEQVEGFDLTHKK
jgi:hypothetical protein